jgi:hypothetical protein
VKEKNKTKRCEKINDVSISMVMMNDVSIKACSTLTTTSVARHDSHSLSVGFLQCISFLLSFVCAQT